MSNLELQIGPMCLARVVNQLTDDLNTIKIFERNDSKSTGIPSKIDTKCRKIGPWGGIGGAMGALGWHERDQERVWWWLDPPKIPPKGPCCGQVGAMLKPLSKFFDVKGVILGSRKAF